MEETSNATASEKLRARQAARAKAKAERAEAELEAKAERELEALEALEAAEKELGEDRVLLVETAGGPVVMKAAHVVAYKAFQDLEDVGTQQFEQLIHPCVVYPKERIDSILSKYPAVLVQLGQAVGRLAGVKAKSFEGK